ncbi:MAG: pyruvate, water dikinase [Halioglobus sp.]|nr:pyruvate, water dikinase [Halioglobus sp.]
MPASILALEAVTDPSVGGKAYGLARLVAMGLNVPPAFVITDATPGDYPAGLAAACAQLGDVALAVRSSARGEDGAEASFAGQYDTVLNVVGEDALRTAIDQCARSLTNERAGSYASRQQDDADVGMNLVVQRMVDARAAGVVFTADPVSARRDLLVIDAVQGLGEALVSGEATPDHYEVDTGGTVITRDLAGEAQILTDAEILRVASEARAAAQREGGPLDLEWAIDAAGELFWLQARPITTLPADLNAFDTPLPRPGDVLTISNVSEMMPGAVSPLTGSFTGWSIDYGLQHMQVTVGARPAIEPAWQVTAWAYGHLFLNLTGNIVMSAGVLGSTPEQTAQSLCGRIVPELKALPALPLWRRILNTGRLLNYCLTAPKVVRRFDEEVAAFAIAHHDGSAAMMAELERHAWFYEHAMAVHIQSSALSGFFSTIVENMVAGQANNPTLEEQAEAVRLLAGASGVESAQMLHQLDELVANVAQQPDAAAFCEHTPEAALAWLQDHAVLGTELAAFLLRHGHRGYRELCIRDPAWGDDTVPLVQSMQASVTARLGSAGIHVAEEPGIEMHSLSRGLRWALPRAHDAIRRREHTKSLLVLVAYRFKQAFRHLGRLLVLEGHLPDADLVNFFAFAELPGFVARPTPEAVALAAQRRDALDYQARFRFPEISVGAPAPLVEEPIDTSEGVLHGRPASRGIVEGVARVANTLEEAAQLQAGEILVTPITDIGWTPYFSMIAGLVTDLGSAVSHGAVIAREYGLPCVVNTRVGTRYIRTGERIRLDGDSGIVTVLPGA